MSIIGDAPQTTAEVARRKFKTSLRPPLSVLSRSGRIIPHPTEWTSVDEDNAILEAAGIKRWNTFRKGASYLSVSLREELSLTPTVNEGGQGFAHLPDQAIRLPVNATALEIGEAVQRALGRCR